MLWNVTLLHVIVRYLQNWMEFPLDPSPPCSHTGSSLMFACFFGQSSNRILVGWGFGALETANASYVSDPVAPFFGRGDQGMFGWLALATKCTRIWTMPARCLGSRTERKLRKFWRWSGSLWFMFPLYPIICIYIYTMLYMYIYIYRIIIVWKWQGYIPHLQTYP